VSTVRTVSDTKRAFYTLHTRPINSIYRRVVEELMVEMHLLSVNVDFRYDPILALGFVTSFDRFMQGYKPEQDRGAIFDALCKSLNADPHQYRTDAQRLAGLVSELSEEDLMAWLRRSKSLPDADDIQQKLHEIAANPQFKYSRLFAIGLFTLLEATSSETLKDNQKAMDAIAQMATAVNLSADKFQKDLELYRSNLEKMAQARAVLDDIVQADRKKREQQAESEATPPASDDSQTSAT
jgi:photosystem II biogenesis protein Psp29